VIKTWESFGAEIPGLLAAVVRGTPGSLSGETASDPSSSTGSGTRGGGTAKEKDTDEDDAKKPSI